MLDLYLVKVKLVSNINNTSDITNQQNVNT